MSRSGTLLDAISGAHKHRFVDAATLRRTTGMPEALTRRNHDPKLQRSIKEELQKRVEGDLSGMLGLPPVLANNVRPGSPLHARVEQWIKVQGALLELGNRHQMEGFTPYPREEMRPLTAGTRPGATVPPVFNSPEDFLAAFDRGLAIIKGEPGGTGFAKIGLLDVGGGAATRAQKHLANPLYREWATRYGITAGTNRNLYPIEGTEVNGQPRTFKGMLIETLIAYARSQGVELPISEMLLPASAGQFARHIRERQDAAQWGDNFVAWCQQEARRYDLNDPALAELPDFYPAGHGDNPVLAYEYGMMEAMRQVGVDVVVQTNGDEFIWVLLLPALLGASAQRNTLDHTNMLSTANPNDQFGGYFANQMQIETNCIPDQLVVVAPSTLNTTFCWSGLPRVMSGFDILRSESKSVYLVSKPTVIDGRLVHLAGIDYWMGQETTAANRAAGGTLTVDEITRNGFDGNKGPQQAAARVPEKFLHGLSTNGFYALVANKIPEWREILLGHRGTEARYRLAERMIRHNLDPILVAMEEGGKLPNPCLCGSSHQA